MTEFDGVKGLAAPARRALATAGVETVAGFTGRSRVQTTSLVDAGGKLPLVITFIDTDEHVSRVLPRLREMAAHRLIVRENVVIEQGSLE